MSEIKEPDSTAEFHEWENVVITAYSRTARMRVPNGWLYKFTIWGDENDPVNVAMCFVPELIVGATD